MKDHMHLGSLDFPIQRILMFVGVCIQLGYETFGSYDLRECSDSHICKQGEFNEGITY